MSDVTRTMMRNGANSRVVVPIDPAARPALAEVRAALGASSMREEAMVGDGERDANSCDGAVEPLEARAVDDELLAAMVAMKRPGLVRGAYQYNGSLRQAAGSVCTENGAWWFGKLSAPIGRPGEVRITAERHCSEDEQGSWGGEITIPLAEVDAVIALVRGLRDQARYDGVLPLE
jgi:hypothetical protein